MVSDLRNFILCADLYTAQNVQIVSDKEENDGNGISLVMESDSLEEDTEEVYFKAEEWGEETMDADL